ncbi:MAG: stage sporulation protein [Clostridiaceae bacterium]|jgi:stage II sporulation protein D|nr:stage sporulation protein [Clostridiaceae bacterium]
MLFPLEGGSTLKKIIVSFHLKRIITIITVILLFIIILPILIVGVNKNLKGAIPKFDVKPNDIIFNENNGGGPEIQVYLTKENKIINISLEEYIRGVVAAEMPAEFSIEALKAQAVAARTFAAAHMGCFGGTKYKDANGADVVDTVQCQVYMDKDSRFKAWPEKSRGEYWNKITEAVKSTAGEILTYNGELVMEPYYFAVSSGKTESSKDVFSVDIGYLKSVSSPGDENARNFKTVETIKLNDFANKVNNMYPNAKLSINNIKKQVLILSTSSVGGVKSIKLGQTTITGPEFRTLFSLNSSNFTLTYNNNTVIITCKGYGHGVGMSQWGANYMAKSGSSYSEILTHYYQGVKIEKLKY